MLKRRLQRPMSRALCLWSRLRLARSTRVRDCRQLAGKKAFPHTVDQKSSQSRMKTVVLSTFWKAERKGRWRDQILRPCAQTAAGASKFRTLCPKSCCGDQGLEPCVQNDDTEDRVLPLRAQVSRFLTLPRRPRAPADVPGRTEARK